MKTFLAIVGGIVIGLILLIWILALLDKYTSWFWKTCKVCNKKQKMFFYVYETNLEGADWDAELKGFKVGDAVLAANDQVCTSCAREHKLFDNYK
jgi:hypothetical protein